MQSGNKQIFDAFIADHHDKIYRICRAYVYYPELTDDLMQEVLINLWSSLSSFKGQSKLTTWAYRVAVNTAISFNKKERNYQGRNSGKLKAEIVDDHSTKEEKIERESQLEKLHRAIATLPKAERLIIGLYLEDIAYKEIASILGTTTNHVGVKLNRIKKELSKKIS